MDRPVTVNFLNKNQRCCISAYWLAKSLEGRGVLALGAMLVLAVLWTPLARAQTYTVLYSFTGGRTAVRPSEVLSETQQAISTALLAGVAQVME